MSFWKRRSIQMPAPVDPEKFEVTYGMGVRETVLVCLAAVQAIWLIFLNESMPFVLRLCIALFVAAVLLGVALIPYKDKPIEYTIAKWIGYRFNHQGRIYRTASRDESEANPQLEIAAPDSKLAPALIPPKAQKVKREKPPKVKSEKPARRWSPGHWLQPDPSLVMAAFLAVLILGSVIAYVGKGGLLKPKEAIAATTEWINRAAESAR